MSYLRVPRSWFLHLLWLSVALLCLAPGVRAQSGMVQGTVTGPSKAPVPGATVRLENVVAGHVSEVKTGTDGGFRFANIPFNPYHVSVTAPGFNTATQDVDVRSSVPVTLDVGLTIGAASTNVTVTESAIDLLETDSTDHTDIDRALFDKLPLESASSSVSSLVTLSSPGIAADSNGLFHGLGDHAENSFSVDGQPINDQQSKVFSNQIPSDAIQSLEVIPGAPPAEYGDKTSVIINVTTRSGLGLKQPTGEVTGSFGSFHTANAGFNLAIGGDKWGNFISANGLNGNRFLDPPESAVIHARGNEENLFDRVDYKMSMADTLSLNFEYSRSWFQNPNSTDALNLNQSNNSCMIIGSDPTYTDACFQSPFGSPGQADQRSQINTFNVAPSWTRVIGTNTVFTLGAFARHDSYNYYPSANPIADWSDTQRESVSQSRTLGNYGVRSSVSIVKGRHNFKAGVTYMATPLNEQFNIGIADPSFNAPCIQSNGVPVFNSGATVFTSTAQCAGAGLEQNVATNGDALGTVFPYFDPTLLPYDLTRGGMPLLFHQTATINEVALFAQDTVTLGNWSLNLGFRTDIYRGLTSATLPEPRVGVAYKIGPSNTVIRISYARTMETPFNENLILSSNGCQSAVLSSLLGCNAPTSFPLSPGTRNEFHAGLQQAFGQYFVLDGEYIWKYTTNAYDFSVLGNTPITFPIQWFKSKIPGFALRASVPNLHGFSAFIVMSSVAARFFPDQIGGAGAVPVASLAQGVFRIDHDEKFNQTTHLQYQPWKTGPWFGVNWRYDSGLVAGETPCYGLGGANDCPQSTTLNRSAGCLSADGGRFSRSAPTRNSRPGSLAMAFMPLPPRGCRPYAWPRSSAPRCFPFPRRARKTTITTRRVRPREIYSTSRSAMTISFAATDISGALASRSST